MEIARIVSMTEREYRALDRENFSRLKLMQRSPLHYQRYEPMADTPAMQLGRIAHSRALEPHREKYAVWRKGRRQGKAWEDFCSDAGARGLEPVSGYDYDLAGRIASALSSRMRPWLESPHHVETSVLWQCEGLQLKSRLDLVVPGTAIVDIKTARDASPREFGISAARLLYHAQAAFYRTAWYKATGERLPFFFAVVESAAPHDVAVYQVSDEQLAAGWELCTAWMDRLLVCRDIGEWPGQCPEVATLQLPSWAMPDDDDEVVTWGGQ